MEVRNLTEGSNLVDPLADESFFPLSTNFSTLPISDTLKSRMLSSPSKLLEKGKAVLEGVMNHLEAYKTNVVRTENEKGRRERRPGLGITLPKFSMKPTPSQPVESLEPTYDLSISDPVEFFQDYARKERAIKEMRLLKGLPLNDYDPDKPVPPRRQRRPGLGLLEGRPRPFSRFSMANDMFDNDITSTTQNEVQQDSNVISDSSSVKLSDSKSKTRSEAPELCDLLPLVDGLDDDGIQNLLREKLNIKDVDVDEIVIPEWRVPFPNSVFKTNGVTKAARINNQASPGKLKSPLALISSLNRHLAKRTASRDLYSPLNIDQLPAEAIDTSTKPKRREDLAGQSCEDSSFLEVNDGDQIIDPREQEVTVIQVDQIGKTKNLLEPENLPIHGVGRIAVSGENSLLSPSGAVHAISELEAQEEVAAAELPMRQIDFESIVMQNSSSYGVEGGMHEPSNMENIQVEEPAKEPRGSSKRTIEENEEPNMPSEADIFEETVEGGGTSKLDVLDPKETRSKRRKVEGGQRGQKKGDTKNRRFSLYDAGTKCENGVRRSTRVRMRPLQYWKGERFLYGRINESLATVIGVKYASPANDTKEPKLKVKSFVSDEHKDLLKYYDLY